MNLCPFRVLYDTGCEEQPTITRLAGILPVTATSATLFGDDEAQPLKIIFVPESHFTRIIFGNVLYLFAIDPDISMFLN